MSGSAARTAQQLVLHSQVGLDLSRDASVVLGASISRLRPAVPCGVLCARYSRQEGSARWSAGHAVWRAVGQSALGASHLAHQPIALTVSVSLPQVPSRPLNTCLPCPRILEADREWAQAIRMGNALDTFLIDGGAVAVRERLVILVNARLERARLMFTVFKLEWTIT